MTTPPIRTDQRVRLPRDVRRASLLEAALAAFSENGYHATSMDDIAERAGVSKPVLYQHFDSKLALYLALAQGVSDEVVDTVARALSSTDDNADRITACISGFFDLVTRPDSGFPLLFLSDMGGQPAVAAVLDDTRRACGEALGQVIAEETGRSWPECVLMGTTLAGSAQTAAMHWYDHRDTLSKEQAIQVVVGLIWRGLAGLPVQGEASAAGSGS